MLSVERMNSDNYDKIISFLSSVPSINNLDKEIINNSAVIIDSDKVVGSISYERYDTIGLIRYFVFKRNMSNELLTKMLSKLNEEAKDGGIEKLVCIADNNAVYELFVQLGFEHINEKIFINEENVNQTAYANADFLWKAI